MAVLDILTDELLAAGEGKGGISAPTPSKSMGLPCLGQTRGLGLMIGVEVQESRANAELAARLMETGLLVLTAGPGPAAAAPAGHHQG